MKKAKFHCSSSTNFVRGGVGITLNPFPLRRTESRQQLPVRQPKSSAVQKKIVLISNLKIYKILKWLIQNLANRFCHPRSFLFNLSLHIGPIFQEKKFRNLQSCQNNIKWDFTLYELMPWKKNSMSQRATPSCDWPCPYLRDAGSWGEGGRARAPPAMFGRWVSPIPTRGNRFCPNFTAGPPIFFYIPASLYLSRYYLVSMTALV